MTSNQTWTPVKEKIVNSHDFQQYAKQNLTESAMTYFKGGSGDETTLNENLNSWKRIFLQQNVLQDVDNVDISTTVLGQKIDFPLGIAPTAMHKLAHPEGEVATSRAAKKNNIPFCLSTLSTCNQKEVAQGQGDYNIRWFQLYPTKDRQTTLKLLKQTEELGYSAVVLTVDVPVFGKRDGDEKTQFTLPKHLQLKMLEEQSDNFSQIKQKSEGSGLMKLFADQMEKSQWSTISWIKEATKLPIILKGIMTKSDAEMAVKMKFDGVWVSNHGGRQLDGALAPIDVLEEISEICKGKCEIFVDGGVRRGQDIFKALALGARCVFVGRPSVFSLACGGQEGVEKMIKIFREEFKRTMELCGAKNVQMINSSFLAEPKHIRDIKKLLGDLRPKL